MRIMKTRKKLQTNKNKKMEEKKQKEKNEDGKELRQIKKAEKLKQDEKETWVRLVELNNNFAKMKEQKKLNKK